MIHTPRIVLRRLWDRDGYGLWFLVKDGERYRYAKPVKIELEESSDRVGSMIPPEPTLIIPREQIQQIYKSFVEELEMEGEPVTEFKQVVKAKDENLKDLRSIIDRMFSERK